jgi:molybdopterin-guanine dinucleotide biosynthesis protein A
MVLCAGTSRRFGTDKMLAPLLGRPLVSHVIENLRKQVDIMALNAPGEAGYTAFGLPVLQDVISGKLGPLAGILTAMEWAQALGAERVLTCAGDTPFLPQNWAQCLNGVGQMDIKVDIVISRHKDREHYTCTLWKTALAPGLRRDLENGVRAVRHWVGTQNYQTAGFEDPSGLDPFLNINTPEDLAAATKILETNRP